MAIKMITYRAGFTNIFFLFNGQTGILVDTGSRGEANKIQKWLMRSGYGIEQINYIFLTHAHYDHAGSAADLKKISGSKVIIQKEALKYLQNGFKPIPRGTTPMFKLISKMGKMRESIERKVGSYPPLEADIEFDDKMDLNPMGFDAKIIHTPGHTSGSSSLVFGDRALVGDCMFNMRGTIYPGFADDEETLKTTWQHILTWDVKWFYPAHGKRFSMDKLRAVAVQKNIQ